MSREVREAHERSHRPVTVKEKTKTEDPYILCLCGWISESRTLDDAWDQYDEHTME